LRRATIAAGVPARHEHAEPRLFPRLGRFQELFPNIEVRVSTTSRKLRYIGSAAARQLELEHVYLQLQAAAEGLGVALASVPLIEADVAAGRLVCPIPAPLWHAGDYELVTNEERVGTPVVRAFRDWIRTIVRAATPHGSQ
jgi:DNA-binding transcriptional LysR family regulator